MTVWSVGISQFALFCFPLWQFSCIFLRVFLYFTILVPSYNSFVFVTMHTSHIRAPLLMSTLPVSNYCFVCVEFCQVRSPAGAKAFSSSLCVQTGSRAHPASCTMGTGGPFPGAKYGRGVTLTTHPI
jgi:hypothetical protein